MSQSAARKSVSPKNGTKRTARQFSTKPKCTKCPLCGAPGVVAERVSNNPIKHVNLLDPLDDLVRVIRNMQCGDYSPIMDEIFDAEHAIRMARGKKLLKGIDWDDTP